MTQYKLLLPLSMLFVTMLLLANTLATKIVDIYGLTVAGGILCFPIAYVINDVFAEVYGYKKTVKVIWFGFFCLILSVLLYQVSIAMPSAAFWVSSRGDSGIQNMDTAYEAIFGMTWRIAIASLLAYLVGSFINAFVMSKLKVITKGRYLWVRTIGSTVAGEGVDSIIFAFVAFYGVFDIDSILTLIWVGFVLKTAYEVIITPVTYLVVRKVKEVENLDVYDDGISYSPFSFKENK